MSVIAEIEVPGCGTTKDEVKELLEKYFLGKDQRSHFGHVEENPLLAIASIVDPRFKLSVN